MNPLIVGVGMDKLIDPDFVTIDLLGRELSRRDLLMEINAHPTESEVCIYVENHRELSYTVAPTLIEAMIDALNNCWSEHKR